MNVSELYPLWLKSHHVPKDGAEATIKRATIEILHPRLGQTSQTVVLSLKGKNRRLILNATNTSRLADMAEENTDKRAGATIRLKPAMFGTKATNGQQAN